MIKVSQLFAAIFLATATVTSTVGASAQQPSQVATVIGQGNKASVEKSFQQWQDGEGSPFSLLSEDVRWTISGSNRFAGTYERGPFIKDLVEPFSKRLKEPLKPTRWDVYEDGNVVIIRFDAEAPLINGEQYRNSYAWFFTFRDREVTRVTAYLDMPAFEAVMDMP
ncbi:MAG: ketosteroid isomerase [Pseudomonadota bacterium]